MTQFTLIARISDGLPLAASMEDDDLSRSSSDCQKRAKEIVRKLSPRSPLRCSIEDNTIVYHYSLSDGVCYLGAFEAIYPKRAAFAYLSELQVMFSEKHGSKIGQAKRPYYFVEFATTIQKLRKTYQDSRNTGRSNLDKLNDELQDVQRIMIDNVDEVLQRGELISVLGDKCHRLKNETEQYKNLAKHINMKQSVIIISIVCVFVFIVFILIWYLFF